MSRRARSATGSTAGAATLAKFAVITWFAMTSVHAWAFPEMSRHAYPNCSACHLSPAGGGALSDYGRGLSHELLSTWGTESEAESAYGLIPFPKGLSLNGDTRLLQLLQDTPATTDAPGVFEGRAVRMQVDVEPALELGNFSTALAVGLSETRTTKDLGDQLVSRRHWLMYRINDNYAIRAGRFYPAYGILFPDHTTATRARLGWDQQMESYNLEAAWTHETAAAFATVIAGRPDSPSLKREVGFALRPEAHLGDHLVAGWSYAYLHKGGESPTSRHLTGPFWIAGFPFHLYSLGEIDIQAGRGTSTDGWVTSQVFGYEPIQGIHARLLADFGRRDFTNPLTWYVDYGLELDFFPRPHWEVEAKYLRGRSGRLRDYDQQTFALIGHFYL